MEHFRFCRQIVFPIFRFQWTFNCMAFYHHEIFTRTYLSCQFLCRVLNPENKKYWYGFLGGQNITITWYCCCVFYFRKCGSFDCYIYVCVCVYLPFGNWSSRKDAIANIHIWIGILWFTTFSNREMQFAHFAYKQNTKSNIPEKRLAHTCNAINALIYHNSGMEWREKKKRCSIYY